MNVTKSITAEDVFSDSLNVLKEDFNFSLSGTWVATVYVQRSFDAGATWVDVESFTANGEYTGYEPQQNVRYRFGVKEGGFTSGTVVGRMGKGGI